VDSGTGSLYIQGQQAIILANADASEFYATFDVNGAATLRYDNSQKLATTATGIDVTGTVTADGLTVDSAVAILNLAGSGYGQVRNTQNTLILEGQGGDGLLLRTGGSSLKRQKIATNGDISFYEDTGITPKFFWDASAESLGIGTSSPSAPLTIGYSGAEAQIQVNNSGGNRMVYLGAFSENEGILRLFNSSNVETVRIPSESTAGVHTYFNAGNVGIGTSSPSGKLEVSGTDAAVSLRVNSANAGVSASNYSQIQLSDNDAVRSYWRNVRDGSGATHFAYGDHLAFLSDAGGTPTERMRIDSSGNLLVSKSSSSFSTVGSEFGSALNSEGWVSFLTSNNTSANVGGTIALNRKSTDGAIARFFKDGITVGSIGSVGGDMYIVTGDTGLRFVDVNDSITATNANGASRDNAVDLGNTGTRFKDLYLSGGVYLGGTGAANKLDDCETGTWTPSLGTGSAIFNLSSYVKVGNLVHVHTQMEAPSDISSNNTIDIFGLPFTGVSDRAMTLGILTQFGPTSAITGGYTSTGTNIRLYYTSAGVYESVKHNQLQSTSFSAYISLSYYTA